MVWNRGNCAGSRKSQLYTGLGATPGFPFSRVPHSWESTDKKWTPRTLSADQCQPPHSEAKINSIPRTKPTANLVGLHSTVLGSDLFSVTELWIPEDFIIFLFICLIGFSAWLGFLFFGLFRLLTFIFVLFIFLLSTLKYFSWFYDTLSEYCPSFFQFQFFLLFLSFFLSCTLLFSIFPKLGWSSLAYSLTSTLILLTHLSVSSPIPLIHHPV